MLVDENEETLTCTEDETEKPHYQPQHQNGVKKLKTQIMDKKIAHLKSELTAFAVMIEDVRTEFLNFKR